MSDSSGAWEERHRLPGSKDDPSFMLHPSRYEIPDDERFGHRHGQSFGMDAVCFMCWTQDVLRDGRSAQSASHTCGSQNRTERSDALSEMRSASAMPRVVTSASRSSVRSRRWRLNSSRTVQDQKETMNRFDTANAYREAAMGVYLRFGKMIPAMWAESEEMIALLEPEKLHALQIGEELRAKLILTVARAIKGSVIGRCDEVHFRNNLFNTRQRETDEFVKFFAETDPGVHRAIAVHALDVRTYESYLTTAHIDIDNEGAPFWQVSFHVPYISRYMATLKETTKMMSQIRYKFPMTQQSASMFASAFGWNVSWFNKKQLMKEITTNE